MSKLTDKQEQFCQEYLIDLNATQAAIRAGYSERTAQEIGSENLSKPIIQTRVAELKKIRQKRVEVDQDKIVRMLLQMAGYDVRDIAEIDEDGTMTLKPSEQWPDDMVQSVQGISQGKFGISIKTADKARAIELLMRHLGMFKEDQHNPANLGKMSPSKLIKLHELLSSDE
ncbi:MAG: terminase small subunit [Aliifodinibius sp.]|nr:terminase small subunit [Fodinibius sp.]